jgi:hypothetical protein
LLKVVGTLRFALRLLVFGYDASFLDP